MRGTFGDTISKSRVHALPVQLSQVLQSRLPGAEPIGVYKYMTQAKFRSVKNTGLTKNDVDSKIEKTNEVTAGS